MKVKLIVFGSLLLGSILINVKQITLLQILLLGFALLRGYDSLYYFNIIINRWGIIESIQVPILILGIISILWGFLDIKIKKKQLNYYKIFPDHSNTRMIILIKLTKLLVLLFIGIFLIPYYICVGEVLGLIMLTYMYPDSYLTVIEAQHTFVMIYTGFIIMAAEFYIICTIFNVWKELSEHRKKSGGSLLIFTINAFVIIINSFVIVVRRIRKLISSTNTKTYIKSVKSEIVVFLLLTFILTYLQDFAMWLNFKSIPDGLTGSNLGISRMLYPAFSAIIINLFIFKNQIYANKPKIFFSYFLILTAFYNLLALFILGKHVQNCFMDFTFLIMAGTILITILHFMTGSREELKTAGLSFGKSSYYLFFGLLIFSFWMLSGLLNRSLGLGKIPKNQANHITLLRVLLSSSFLSPISGLPIFFGEEYGWRIYLQDKLTKLYGHRRGIILLGVIWGLWHFPIIAMGHNYPGYPYLGSLLMILYTINMSMILGLAVIKSRSVWLAAFLHGLNNGTATFQHAFICTPNNPIYSFGGGLYGMVIFAVIIIAILKYVEYGEPNSFTPMYNER